MYVYQVRNTGVDYECLVAVRATTA